MYGFSDKVKQLLVERSEELYKMMIGSSIYCNHPVKNIPTTRSEVLEHNLASKYVKFVAKYGFDVKEVRDGNCFYVSHPDHFDRWVLNGCLGLDSECVDLYLTEHPL